MKALFLAMGLGVPAMTLAMGVAIADSGEEARTRALNLEQAQAAKIQTVAITQSPATPAPDMKPLNQVESLPDMVANARVTDLHGKVVGAVQKVEIQNGRALRVDIALLGSANLVTLDAASLRYDAASNVVATGESVAQLMARTQT